MNPTSSPSTFASTMYSRSATERSQVVSTPASADPTTLPTAPTAAASAIDTTPTPTDTMDLARITWPRRGTSVNVVSPVRWLHSAVTDMIAMIGRMIVIGTPTPAANEL